MNLPTFDNETIIYKNNVNFYLSYEISPRSPMAVEFLYLFSQSMHFHMELKFY